MFQTMEIWETMGIAMFNIAMFNFVMWKRETTGVSQFAAPMLTPHFSEGI